MRSAGVAEVVSESSREPAAPTVAVTEQHAPALAPISVGRRGEDPLDATLARAVAARASREHAPARQLQRVITQAAFDRLAHSVVAAAPQAYAQVTRNDGVKCVAKRSANAGNFDVVAENAQNVTNVVPDNTLKANYSWPDEAIVYGLPKKEGGRQRKAMGADAMNQVGPGGDALTIYEFAGDELAMVHYTTGGDADPHLTVENAHIGAMHHIKDMRTIGGFNKAGKDKGGHEDFMAGYDSARTDNLNFFPKAGLGISLEQYLRVIRHAMDQIPNVPPVYGVEIVRSANAMARAKGLDPAQLFLAGGVGMDRQLFKAALNMHKMGLLDVPQQIVTAFAGYASSQPQLTDPDSNEVVKEATGPWTALQQRLIKAHLPALLNYLNSL